MRLKMVAGIALLMLMLLPMYSVMPLITNIQTESVGMINENTPAAGARLSSYAEHVPIIITSDSDWDTQGWPGSGTVGDPYIISGLNITYDVGLPMINITNTNVYFKVVDCVINQLNNVKYSIYVVNVTHAVFEYLTVTSIGLGIFLENADNTVINGVDAIVETSAYALFSDSSDNLRISNCNFTSTGFRGIGLVNAVSIEFTSTIVKSNPSWYSVYVSTVNNSLFSDVTSNGGTATIRLTNMWDSHLSNIMTTQANRGISGSSLTNITIDNVSFDTVSNCIDITGVTDLSISNSIFESDSDAVVLDVVSDLTIHSNEFKNSKRGLKITNSHDIEIRENLIHDTTSNDGIYVSDSNDTTIVNNDIYNIADNGIEMLNVINQLISNNNVHDIVNDGITLDFANDTLANGNQIRAIGGTALGFSNSYNMTSTNNVVEMAAAGIYHQSSGDITVQNNNVHDISDEAIYVNDGFGTIVISDNTVENTDNTGIYIASSHYAQASDNTVSNAGTGLYIENSENCTITGNIVSESTYGLYTDTAFGTGLINNTVSASTIGIFLDSGQDMVLQGNIMTDCGFYLTGVALIEFYRMTFSDNMVNGKPVYFGHSLSSVDINGDDYGQVIVVNSTDVTIHDGVFVKPTVPIHVIFSSFVTISDIVGLSVYTGINVFYSNNVTISNTRFNSYEYLGSLGSTGIDIRYSYNISLSNIELTTDPAPLDFGIYLQYGSVIVIDGLQVTDTSDGIYSFGTDNVTVRSSSFTDNGNGIYATASSLYWEINNSTFVGGDYGIYTISGSQFWLITESSFLYCGVTGVYGASSNNDYYNITNSYFEGNQYGVYINYGDNWNILNNEFWWNQQGIHMIASIGDNVYGNTFVGNHLGNAYDDGGQYWDDGVDTGNTWDDYSGSGAYDIPGGSSQDRYPQKFSTTLPKISHHLDVEYPEGTQDYMMTWYAVDDYLVNWEAYLDGQPFDSGAWNFDNITLNIGGLSYGEYVLYIIIYDLDNNNVSDSILITVYDDTPPEIDYTPFMLGFVGGSNQYIIWNVSDAHPTNYSIYVDGTPAADGTWTTGELAYDVSSLAAGDHDVMLVVRDIDLNEAGATIHVRMLLDNTAPSINSPADLNISYGTTGNYILWTPSDLYPDRYEVSLNGSVIASGDWDGGAIAFNVDGLDLGTYTFTLTVYDKAGNSASDTVGVFVVASPYYTGPTTTTAPPGPIIDPLVLIAGAGIAIGVVIVVAIIYKKKRSV